MSEIILTAQGLEDFHKRAEWYKGHGPASDYASDVPIILEALERVQRAVHDELNHHISPLAQRRLRQALRETGWEVKDGKEST